MPSAGACRATRSWSGLSPERRAARAWRLRQAREAVQGCVAWRPSLEEKTEREAVSGVQAALVGPAVVDVIVEAIEDAANAGARGEADFRVLEEQTLVAQAHAEGL